MDIHALYDEATFTLTYIVYDAITKDAIVIDTVMDYEPRASTIDLESIERICDFVNEHRLCVHYILETHAHADHLSGSQELKERYPGAKTVIGKDIIKVQRTFRTVFDLPDEFATDGRQFDVLVEEGDTLQAGSIAIGAIATPGHTPADLTYVVEDALFCGDVLFMPDSGTGRCDFPGGDADAMYTSVAEKVYRLPDETRMFVGHDYQPNGRPLAFETSVGQQKASNIFLDAATSRSDFVARRNARDASLAAPRLLFQSIQVNIAAGRMPKSNTRGVAYLKVPINVFRPAVELETVSEEAIHCPDSTPVST